MVSILVHTAEIRKCVHCVLPIYFNYFRPWRKTKMLISSKLYWTFRCWLWAGNTEFASCEFSSCLAGREMRLQRCSMKCVARSSGRISMRRGEGGIVLIYVVCINSRALYLASSRRHVTTNSSIQMDLPLETQRMPTSKPKMELPNPLVWK